MSEPTIRVLSLGAGVQSTTLLLMACEGILPKLDAAIFADTGWEPRRVYEHLDLITAVSAKAGIPVLRVSKGSLREDVLNPDKLSAIPAYTLRADGHKGMQSRKCTQKYKLTPIHTQVRRMLGASVSVTSCRYCDGGGSRVAPWRAKRGEVAAGDCSVCGGTGEITRVGQPPAGRWAEQWIGFSTDEIIRVSSRGDTRYARSRHPLLELGMSREQCISWLRSRGWTSVAKSACIGCPYHGNRHWRQMRDENPAEFAEAVAFDEAYRHGAGMDSERFLHISCQPLAEAPINRVRPSEHLQLSILDADFDARLEEGHPDGCSPYGCRSGQAVTSSRGAA